MFCESYSLIGRSFISEVKHNKMPIRLDKTIGFGEIALIVTFIGTMFVTHHRVQKLEEAFFTSESNNRSEHKEFLRICIETSTALKLHSEFLGIK